MKRLIIFALIPLFLSIGIQESFEYGSGGKPDPRVCGDRLCSEVPGGKVAFERLGGILEENMDKVEITKNYSPLKQMEDGVAAEDVVCKESLKLVIRPNGQAACMDKSNFIKLESWGWVVRITTDINKVNELNWLEPENRNLGETLALEIWISLSNSHMKSVKVQDQYMNLALIHMIYQK